uniref:Uncharacterized protein n=1 Tax=Lepeophtheirus salmonis TaxID=72036 RepID=A0A0K2T6L3_LEPSM
MTNNRQYIVELEPKYLMCSNQNYGFY